jgi:glycosyltransferase involved in cell wall biosynthesis
MSQERFPNRLRLLLLESLTFISGGQAVLLNLVPRLGKRYDPIALLPGPGPLAEELCALGVTHAFAPMGRYSLLHKTPLDVVNYAARLPWLVLFTWRLVRRRQVDLLYANSTPTFVWGTLAAALAHRPILWHMHNVLGDGKTLRLLAALSRLRTVKRIVCASPGAAAQFDGLGAPAAKFRVVPNGVDLDRFAPSLAARERIRAQYRLDPHTPLVGIAGDLIPLKGQQTFVEAARLVHAQMPAVHFWIVGQPRPTRESHEYQAALQLQAGSLPIDLIGHQPDMPAVLNALDVLVIASTAETGPLVLLEALACGIPVVSTPVGRTPELLAGGECGALFPIGDAVALAGHLLALLADPDRRQAMGRAARERAVSRLSLDAYRQQIDDEIEAALRTGGQDSSTVTQGDRE